MDDHPPTPNAFLPLTMMSSSVLQQAKSMPMHQAKPPAPDIDTSSLAFKAVEKVIPTSMSQQQEIQPLSKEIAAEPAPALGIFAQTLRGTKIPAPSYTQQLHQHQLKNVQINSKLVHNIDKNDSPQGW